MTAEEKNHQTKNKQKVRTRQKQSDQIVQFMPGLSRDCTTHKELRLSINCIIKRTKTTSQGHTSYIKVIVQTWASRSLVRSRRRRTILAEYSVALSALSWTRIFSITSSSRRICITIIKIYHHQQPNLMQKSHRCKNVRAGLTDMPSMLWHGALRVGQNYFFIPVLTW